MDNKSYVGIAPSAKVQLIPIHIKFPLDFLLINDWGRAQPLMINPLTALLAKISIINSVLKSLLTSINMAPDNSPNDYRIHTGVLSFNSHTQSAAFVSRVMS